MSEVNNPIIGYADTYRAMARHGKQTVEIWSVITDLERNMAPLMTAAQSELAALREELADRKRKHLHSCQIAIGKSQLAKELQQRLTAAEQRNSNLVELLRELDENWNSHDGRERFSLAMRKVEAALKPTESGASE